MFKFFKSIRQRLLWESRFSKYLLYAIGEIILVVIGILIALQVNNWSEERKERALEIEVLMEIQKNIEQELRDHEENIFALTEIIEASDAILNHLENGLPYHDSLASTLHWLVEIPGFYPVKSGYELLSSKGVNLISNDSLRQGISFLYEYNHRLIQDWFDYLGRTSHQMLMKDAVPKFKKFKSVYRKRPSYQPKDYQKLLKDDEFMSYVQFNQEYVSTFKLVYEDAIEYSEQLIVQIEEEISNLRNL